MSRPTKEWGVGPREESADDSFLHIEARHRSWPIDIPHACDGHISSSVNKDKKILVRKKQTRQNRNHDLGELSPHLTAPIVIVNRVRLSKCRGLFVIQQLSNLLPEPVMTFISRIVAKPAFRSSFQPVTRINITSRSYAAMGHSVPPVSRSPTLFPTDSHSVAAEMHNTIWKQTLPTEIASDGVFSVGTVLFPNCIVHFCSYTLNDPSLFKQQAFINGKWVDAKSGQTFDVHDPATHKPIGKMPEMNKEDAQLAIDAAAAAFPKFRKTTARERAKMLRKWYDLMVENAEDIARLITWENGKPMADAKGEAAYAANFFEWFSEEAPRAYGDTISATVAGNRVFTLKEPVGVCGLITPWNFPAAMITRKIGPALAAGCTVVAKSPGETPFTAAALAELSVRAGIPPGVVNIITAMKNTPEVGEAITSSDIVKKVSFTGSTGVGKLLMKQSADTLKKLSFELGGNAPFIVFDDADLETAVNGAIASKFRSSGQTCVCANRLYIQRGIYDKFAEAFTEKVKNFKVGHGYDEGVTHGPLIHDRAVSKVEAHVKDAVKQGGKVLVGGQKLPDLGNNFFQPTVIRDMTADMALAHEETFGPIAGLFPFDTEAEVVKLANDTEVGLAGYFFSRDIQRVYRVAEALEVGMVGVNTGLISDPAAPFGGVKQSGFGREGSKIGIDEYMVTKMVTLGGMGQPLQGE
ncbi:succinic semialdehyde dehydrogenase, partial [Aureobasidium melanogenum]